MDGCNWTQGASRVQNGLSTLRLLPPACFPSIASSCIEGKPFGIRNNMYVSYSCRLLQICMYASFVKAPPISPPSSVCLGLCELSVAFVCGFVANLECVNHTPDGMSSTFAFFLVCHGFLHSLIRALITLKPLFATFGFQPAYRVASVVFLSYLLEHNATITDSASWWLHRVPCSQHALALGLLW